MFALLVFGGACRVATPVAFVCLFSLPCSFAVAHVCFSYLCDSLLSPARLAQPVERKALNLVVVGSSPTVGVLVDVLSFVLLGFSFHYTSVLPVMI